MRKFRAAPRPIGVAFVLWALVGWGGLVAYGALASAKPISGLEAVVAWASVALPFVLIGRFLLSWVGYDRDGIEIVNTFVRRRLSWSDVREIDDSNLSIVSGSGQRVAMTALRAWRRPYGAWPTEKEAHAVAELKREFARRA